MPDGVFDLTDPDLREQILAKTDIIDIWGINKRTAVKLHAVGVKSALQLRDMDIRQARKLLTFVGFRVVDELRGVSCLQLEMMTPLKKSICCSRSFASEVWTLTEMNEAVINHLSTAAERMRGQRLVANAIQVFIHTNLFKEKGLCTNSATIKTSPTDSTRELLGNPLRLLKAICKPGHGYRKAGIVLLGLQTRTAETQRLLNEDVYT